MAYDKDYDEKSWDYLKRKCPDIYEALYSIDRLYEAKDKLFGGTWYWSRDEKGTIADKATMGCLQLEIQNMRDKLQEVMDKMDEIEEKHKIVKEKEKEWHAFAREKHKVVFENGAGDLEKVPRDLLKIMTEDRSFDGRIQSDGKFVKFVRDEEVISKVPKSLVNQLREEPYQGGGG